MRSFIVFISIAILASCDSKPSKSEALDYYEEIYKTSAPVRVSERNLLNNLAAYIDSMETNDSGWINLGQLNAMKDSNEVVISNIEKALQSINNLPEFETQSDLREPCRMVLRQQLDFHQNNVSKIFEVIGDGAILQEEQVYVVGFEESYENIKVNYKDWKAVRKMYCNEFGIVYDDIKAFEDKYAPQEAEE